MKTSKRYITATMARKANESITTRIRDKVTGEEIMGWLITLVCLSILLFVSGCQLEHDVRMTRVFERTDAHRACLQTIANELGEPGINDQETGSHDWGKYSRECWLKVN